MLQLQRASAGSGKTYMLAKKFIEYFISTKEKDGRRRLRHPRELRESLSGILAVTFTNKATNEMKLRIVDKLDALGSWTSQTPIGQIDYLQEFSTQFKCSPQEIANLCRQALKILLTDYGDFKVSTIDSFFQTVLRTFAYEADLDDTYQLELDSNYVTQMGLDTTLDEIDTSDTSSQGTTWIASMMEEKASLGKGWNIFQKNESRSSVYGQILTASRNLSKEDFKKIRKDLDDYFKENPDFYTTFHRLCKVYETDLRNYFSDMRKAAIDVREAFLAAGLDINATAGQYLASRVRKMAETWEWDYADDKDTSFKIPQFTRKGSASRVFNPKITENPHLGTATEDHIESLAIRMFSLFDAWRTEAKSDRMKKWRIYKATMPYVGLLQSVRGNSRLFLTDTNTVELGETNSILHRIIGDDDAPFVYERLGSRLEHFLIDEFQDTSRLQWINLKPLLSESESKGNDNLIIGDAKQSIYRFRNADPSLITTRVPEEFADTCHVCGNTPAENTNWRSSRRIVEFNNLFFRFFTGELEPDMEALYSNTIQPSHHKDDYGFVSVQLFKKESDEDIPAHFDEIPHLIADMLQRGYSKKDIAVLVDTREQGSRIIDRIMAYNISPDIKEKIDFISADSLKVGESPAVQTVVSILEAIDNGTSAELRKPEERKKKGVGDWSRLKADFSFYAVNHPESSLSELLMEFLDGGYDPDTIHNMLGEMSTTVLPALTENIIQKFIPDRMRNSQAPFLAAFQDHVLDFCEGHSADIDSFLEWWNKKGRNMSISSPEDADAVQIMTVHKSKGLEFRCVIVPYSKQTIHPISAHEKEWLWVRPDLSEAEGLPHIPWIPVWSDKKLAETIHADTYVKYLKKYLMDKVNMAYVAYTRAVDELYIYTPITLNKDGSPATGHGRIGEFLWACGTEVDDIISSVNTRYPASKGLIPEKGNFSIDNAALKWTYGEIPTREEVIATTAKRKKNDGDSHGIPVSSYRCGIRIPALIYNNTTDPGQQLLPQTPEDEDDLAETAESRRFGELMHSIMEQVITPADLPRVLLRMKTLGHIDRRQMVKYGKDLAEAMESVTSYGWFAPGVRVINERGILTKGKLRRPDRVVLRPDGTAVVVDYKFGDHRKDKQYAAQARRYAETLVNAGLTKKSEAYIWYVNLGKVLKAL